MTATDKVSVLLVGIGGYGASYLDALLDEGDLRGAELVGAVDPKPHARRLPDLVSDGMNYYLLTPPN